MIARPYPGSRIRGLNLPPPQKKNISPVQKDVLKMHKFSFEFLMFLRCSYCIPPPPNRILDTSLNGSKTKINKLEFFYIHVDTSLYTLSQLAKALALKIKITS